MGEKDRERQKDRERDRKRIWEENDRIRARESARDKDIERGRA